MPGCVAVAWRCMVAVAVAWHLQLATNIQHLRDREAHVREHEREYQRMKKGWAELQKQLSEREGTIIKLKKDAHEQRLARNQLRQQLVDAKAAATASTQGAAEAQRLQQELVALRVKMEEQAHELQATKDAATVSIQCVCVPCTVCAHTHAHSALCDVTRRVVEMFSVTRLP